MYITFETIVLFLNALYLADSTNSSKLNLTQIIARKGTVWKICPTASQWKNELAELGVKAFKETLAKVTTGNQMNYANADDARKDGHYNQ